MKISTLIASAALGMASVGSAVYAVTPSGSGWQASSRTQSSDDVESPKPAADTSSNPIATSKTISEFRAGSTLQVEGRMGHRALLAGQSQETYVLLELEPSSSVGAKSPSVSLSLVIDKSGSMAGTRIANALAAATTAVQRLHDGDTVNVVAFDTKTEVVVPPTRLSSSSRAGVESAIKNIHLGGDTCISCGIDEGLNQLAAAKRSGPVDIERMLLLSDGAPTDGVREPEGFTTLAQKALGRGVGITTVGVNLEYNERVMTAIALGSNGGHYFVENESGLAAVFQQEATKLEQTVASNAIAHIDLAPGVELLQLPNREFERSGSRITVPLGGFSKGAKNTVLMKVRLSSPKVGPFNIADIRVNYRDLTTQKDVEERGSLAVDIVDSQKDASEMDGVVLERVQKSETAAALLDANNLFRVGKVDEAQKRLDAARTSLKNQKSKAATNKPSSRTKSIDAGFDEQEKVLKRASGEFSPAPAMPAPKQEHARKAAPRANAEDAFNSTR